MYGCTTFFCRMGYKDVDQIMVLEFNYKHGAKRPNNRKGYIKVFVKKLYTLFM